MIQKPVQRGALRGQRIGDELYLFGPDGQSLAVLNATSMLVWSMCDGEHTPRDMTKVLQDIFPDMGADTLQEDVENCLARFAREALIEAPG